jgi:hypothetical protein
MRKDVWKTGVFEFLIKAREPPSFYEKAPWCGLAKRGSGRIFGKARRFQGKRNILQKSAIDMFTNILIRNL